VLVLHEQQLDVEQLEQLEHEQLELHQPNTISSTALRSSISKVSVSRARSSSWRFGIGVSPPLGIPMAWFPFAQLVLLQLLDVHEQQLDVEQLEQLDVLVLLLHRSVMEMSRSEMSSISNVSVARARSSSCNTAFPFPRLRRLGGPGGGDPEGTRTMGPLSGLLCAARRVPPRSAGPGYGCAGAGPVIQVVRCGR
jgi:hypothetical protein